MEYTEVSEVQLIGQKASKGKASGVLVWPEAGEEIPEGCILGADMTTPDLVPQMRKAAGILTALGGRLCHAAIVSREMGKPCVVGLGLTQGEWLRRYKAGTMVTVDGDTGTVTYEEETA
jgi:pyruvate,water dikinase